MDFSLSSSLVGNAVSNPDKLALDLQFATDKTLTARKGPTPVFTRGSNATFVSSDRLVRYAPNNFALYSGAIVSGTGWLASQVTSVVDDIGPDGNNAYTITEDTTTNVHGVSNTGGLTGTTAMSVVSGITYTGSIFLKKITGGVDWVQLTFGGGGFGSAQYANFNISTGVVGSFAGSTATIEAFPNGWYRCRISVIASTTTTTTGGLGMFFTNNTNSTTRAPSYTGNASNKFLAAMCQFEIGSTISTYIPTTTAAIYGPRFDHDPITGVCKGLLMEESRTNIMPRSQDFTTGWTVTNLQTVTSGFTSPSGDSNACSLVENNLSGIHSVQLASPSAVTAGSPYTASVYAKENGATSFQLVFSTTGLGAGHANFVLSGNGSIGTFNGVTATIERLSNGWYRCSMTVASAPGSGANSSILVVALNDNNSSAARIPSYLGDNATGVFVWGAQLELGAFPTSYIPTTTASVVRSADVCSITGSDFSGFYNQPEGTLVTSSTRTSTNFNAFIGHYSDNSFNNGFDVRYSSSTQVSALMNVANSNQVPAMVANITSGSTVKQAFSYKLNDCGYSVNGAATITDTSALIPTATRMAIGNAAVPSQTLYLNGTISSMRYFKKRLANAKLQALTV